MDRKRQRRALDADIQTMTKAAAPKYREIAVLPLLFFTLLAAPPAHSQPDRAAGAAAAPASPPASLQPSEPLAAALERIRAEAGIPALAGAIVAGDRVTEIAAVGRRQATSEEPVTIHDAFHLGSCTKAMTATLAGMLIERGKLRWDTTIAEVFPDLRESMHADVRDVTVAQLLSHRSGLPANFDPQTRIRLVAQPGDLKTVRRQLVQQVARSAPVGRPGSEFAYSNLGYVIVGAMIEETTGRAWEDAIREMLFEPLGMKSAGFGPPGDAAKVDQPRGHFERDGEYKPMPPSRMADNPAALGPAGTVHAPLGDWARFVSLHLAAARGDHRLLKQETARRLHETPDGSDYACGWGVLQRAWGGRVLTHAGSNTMWFAVVWASPERGFAVLAATNCASEKAQQACDQAASMMIERHLKGVSAASQPAGADSGR